MTFIPTYFNTNQSLIKVTAAINNTLTQVSVYLSTPLVILILARFHETWRSPHNISLQNLIILLIQWNQTPLDTALMLAYWISEIVRITEVLIFLTEFMVPSL